MVQRATATHGDGVVEGMQGAPFQRTDRHRGPVTWIEGWPGEGERNCQVSCAFCFTLLRREPRELLVATITASNVLQSSACLSQGPRGDVGAGRGGDRVPQQAPSKIQHTHTGTHVRLLYGHARYRLPNVTTHPSIRKEKYKISTTPSLLSLTPSTI